MTILERLQNGENIKNLHITELKILAKEIRGFLLEKVSKTGGHLASNLGVVEITIALCYVFDFPSDKIIWDVGHQSYVYKILTGRAEQFDTLRQFGGLSGFPRKYESEYDCFDTGHSSTSVSAALGMAKARDLKGEKNNIIAFIGDGSLGGGLAYEAINDAGNSNTKMLIILNDNEMSIAKNVGGMSVHLSSFRTSGGYFRFKQSILSFLEKTEQNVLIKFLRGVKNSIKHSLLQNTVFEGLGLTYFGPFYGHDIERLIKILKRVKNVNEPVIMHIRTIKGKGYGPAERKPSEYHGVSSFDYKKGIIPRDVVDYSAVFGDKLCDIAETNEKVVAITAAMPDGTGLKTFGEKYPERFFDVGIAEQHAVTSAAGMAVNGLVPVVAVYSTFFQRAYDSILHDVCLQNLHVVFCADRAGIVGADGETHQGLFDISFMRPMPNVEILAPSDYTSFKNMLDYAVNTSEHPVFIRYPRGEENVKIYDTFEYKPGKATVLKTGEDVALFACGKMVSVALKTAEILNEKDISSTVIDIHCLSDIDLETLIKFSDSSKVIVTLEDGVVKGGIGEAIAEKLHFCSINKPVLIKGFNKGIVEQGSGDKLFELYRVSPETVAEDLLDFLGENV